MDLTSESREFPDIKDLVERQRKKIRRREIDNNYYYELLKAKCECEINIAKNHADYEAKMESLLLNYDAQVAKFRSEFESELSKVMAKCNPENVAILNARCEGLRKEIDATCKELRYNLVKSMVLY